MLPRFATSNLSLIEIEEVKHALRAAHFPQHIHVDAAFATGNFVRHLRLMDTALDADTR